MPIRERFWAKGLLLSALATAAACDDKAGQAVLAHFGKLEAEPKRAEARFLRQVSRRLYDEGAFSVVLTPFFDRLHRDHFHLDMARYRIDGTRP